MVSEGAGVCRGCEGEAGRVSEAEGMPAAEDIAPSSLSRRGGGRERPNKRMSGVRGSLALQLGPPHSLPCTQGRGQEPWAPVLVTICCSVCNVFVCCKFLPFSHGRA